MKLGDRLAVIGMVVSVMIGFGIAGVKIWSNYEPTTVVEKSGVAEKSRTVAPPGVVEKLGVVDFEAAVLVTLAGAILSLVFRCWTKSLEAENQMKVLEQKIDQETMLSSVMSRLIRSHPLVKEVGIKTLLAQTASIQPVGRGFSVSDTNWAMRSNTNFWKTLNDFSRTSELGERKAVLKCSVVHSGSPHTWKGPDALASLEQQKAFVNKGGKIDRIIVGPHTKDEIKQGINKSVQARRDIRDIMGHIPQNRSGIANGHEADSYNDQVTPKRVYDGITVQSASSEDYGDLIRIMNGYGVTVYYAQGSQRDDYLSDFALVKHGERSVVMEWVNAHALGPVKQCIFHDLEENDEFEDRWRVLELKAENMTEYLKDRSSRSGTSAPAAPIEQRPSTPALVSPAAGE
jgi:hypothetical protein